jgi:hypothetical protein
LVAVRDKKGRRKGQKWSFLETKMVAFQKIRTKMAAEKDKNGRRF